MREICKSGSVGEAGPKHQGEDQTGTNAEPRDTAKPKPTVRTPASTRHPANREPNLVTELDGAGVDGGRARAGVGVSAEENEEQEEQPGKP